jgi:hypothetical protein
MIDLYPPFLPPVPSGNGLDADELADIRSDITRGYPTPVTIQRQSATNDGTGIATLTWSSIATVNGYLIEDDAAQVVVGEQPRMVTVWYCHLPIGTDVQPQDRCVIDGGNYLVEGLDAGQSEALQIVVRLRKVGA